MDTPIYPKENNEMEWPDDSLFYLITSEGMMKCRNTQFFRSCVKATSAPSELEVQRPFLKLRYPKIPQHLLEQVVGFFSEIQKKYDAEAYVCLCWNKETNEYVIICPPQDISAAHVHYDVPELPANIMLVGDIHSHVNMSAYSSGVDEHDEEHRPGVHLVIGKISTEPPEFHCEAVVDGTRFAVSKDLMLDKYEKRAEFPPEWMDRIEAKKKGGSLPGFKTYRKEEYQGAGNAWHGMDY